MTNQNKSAQAATQEAVQRALELYAECYDTMTRIAHREGREPVVSPVSVAIDIRRNMVNAVLRALSLVRAPVAGEAVTDEMVQAGAKAAREYLERTGGNAPAEIYRAMRAAAPAAAQASAEHVHKVRADAFTAGFICAGGDAEEAKQQAPQFQACIDAGREHNHRRTRADTALPVPLGSLQTAPYSPSFQHPLSEPAKPYDQQDGIQRLRDYAGTVTDVVVTSLASVAYQYAMTLSFVARTADSDQVERVARRMTAKLEDEIRAIISSQGGSSS
ncbi:hypothetical protein ABW38_10545 [Achromobacter xylosoxidans]|uniref:hypothetical protein n=1 Tax=Achromobacter TaxID=222 RepID=UPI0006AC9F46|nr:MULTISPECIES: hypothetical protein [Achromobacter]KOQ29492.1 hypothetical protein ABW34_05680 [Achromobacter xylosoxidans]KOQ29769.1 hypothetical protein ABW35_03675 [Achromobacter xylosoxidans]KOQ34594.1 hypothetical protein ABW36_05535 [Achromobacter xylosoxidans]KOQ45559.1 hypothetical protein ABW37_05890 [Achromobacter xylosoxidans]KOQ50511.1 hypothetical protein ABW38_10545 [Achromobacter xylosoxidans]